MRDSARRRSDAELDIAASAMIAAETDASPEGVRDFLDSRHGRHFADDVASELWNGRDARGGDRRGVARWMGWRIDRRTSRDEGIPRRASLPDRLRQPLRDPRPSCPTDRRTFQPDRRARGMRGSGS